MKTPTRFMFLAAALLTAAPLARAYNHKWTGEASSAWGFGMNWTNGVPNPTENRAMRLFFPSFASRYDTLQSIDNLVVDYMQVDGMYSFGGGQGAKLSFRDTNTVASSYYSLSLDGGSTFDSELELGLTMPVGFYVQGTQIPNSLSATILGRISGPGELHLHGGSGGRLRLGGTLANTYAGMTWVHSGEMQLDKTGATAVPHELIIGTDFLNTTPGKVVCLQENQLGNHPLTLRANGRLELKDGSQSVSALTMAGGRITMENGSLSLNGNMVVEESATNAVIEGRLFCSGPRQFTVLAPAATNGLELNAQLSGLAAATLTKAGPGWMTVSGSNVYAGSTVVADGVLRVAGERPLGQTTQGTRVDAGGTLYLDGISVTDEPLRLSGAGHNGLGALNGLNASWDGDVTLADDASVGSWPGSALRLSGALTGAGGLRVQGGTVALTGITASTYTGETHVDGGTLELRKQITIVGGEPIGLVSVPGSLFIGDGSGTDTVRLFADNAIGDTAAVSLAPNGVLDMNGHRDSVGSLSGLSGSIALGDGELAAGSNGQSTVCGVVMSGTGRFRKVGAGALTLTAAQMHTGGTVVEGGTLVDNGALKNVTVKANASLAGNGQTEAVTLEGGILSPGAGFGRLTTKNLSCQVGSTLQIELNGLQAGVNYDQLQVNGVVTLTGAALEVLLSHAGDAGSQYVILSNDGSDAVIGTFAGKPQGATFTAGGAQFQISYAGGDGNDVVLTQLTASSQFPPPTLTVEALGLAQARVLWSTNSVGFQLQSTPGLGQPNWQPVPYAIVPVGEFNSVTVPTTTNGVSFYRLVKP